MEVPRGWWAAVHGQKIQQKVQRPVDNCPLEQANIDKNKSDALILGLPKSLQALRANGFFQGLKVAAKPQADSDY